MAEFDYIIIGAGSAGCVLADRLSASGRDRVLLIEAGGSDRKFWIKIPLGYGFTFSDSNMNWGYTTQSDRGLNGRSLYWPRGKVIGGSGSINAMAYVRGLPHDFDDWEAAGATGWNWNNVEQAYDQLETNDEFNAAGIKQLRGKGPLCVTDLSDQMHPFSRRFLQAAEDIGWPLLDSMNGTQKEGLAYYRSNVRNGFRHSPADAFLRPALKRQNLKIITHAQVTRLQAQNGRMSRVHYRIDGQSKVAKANCEVILSAGAINSPQLLQLSGIGPTCLLKAHGIDVQLELDQVGKGLQDHLAVTHYFTASEATLNQRLGNWPGRMLAGIQYLLTRRGPLSVPVNQVGGFVRSSEQLTAPNVQIFCNPASYSVPASGKPVIDREPGYLLSAQPCRPTSRGEVFIASADPLQAPLINPNSLHTAVDQQAAIQASLLIRKLMNSPTLARVTLDHKQPDIAAMNEDELLENFRNRASTVFHPTCTCRMGRSQADSVVDSRLRVHGIQGLRVVDASAFPSITSGNTNAPTLMLALRAAQMILQDNRG